MYRYRLFFSAFLLICLQAVSQKSNNHRIKKADQVTLSRLKTHVAFLADDRLEGRRAGSAGEKLAMEYISNEFKTAGLLPKGTDGFFQPFPINEGVKIGNHTSLTIEDKELVPGKDFFPFPFSAEGKTEALPSLAIRESGMPWFIDLKETLEEARQNPHFDLVADIKTQTEKAIKQGAAAVFFYNTSAIDDNLFFDAKNKSAKLGVPVVYVSKEAAKNYFSDVTATVDIKLNVAIEKKERTGHNVIGFIDNGAAQTVILGAHFDHLGYGEDGNSMLRTGEKLIHNGADDNASGTAALIELSRLVKQSGLKKNNYLFIAFSGEELGLFGSKYFTEYPTIDLSKANYMINMDMVGRLNDSSKLLTIGGYGTSPQWASVISPAEKKLSFVIRTDSSGSGPSDHTSFYRKDIPVLFFFTGQHKDYHRPGDDAAFINYHGELAIVNYIFQLVSRLDNAAQKLAFLKTREAQVSMSAFKVTLGIMPDYTYSGSGVRADGVTEGRPASKAGVKAGDVITKLGDHTVTSVETYMQALSKFNKGDTTVVTYKRGNEELKGNVAF